MSQPIVYIDVETSGLTDQDQICSFAACRYENGAVTDTLSFVCKPTCPIHPDAARVNGFTEAKLENEAPFATFAPKVVKILEGAVIASHNIVFDTAFLDRELSKAGTPGLLENAKCLCTLATARKQYGHKLLDCCRFYGIEPVGPLHDALNDVKTGLKVLLKQIEMDPSIIAEEPKTVRQTNQDVLDRYLRKADDGRWLIAFGKHKDRHLDDPALRPYLRWVLSQKFPAKVHATIKAHLALKVELGRPARPTDTPTTPSEETPCPSSCPW